ncbi:MAG: 1-aminocyclopropane-1-carboxylate deaminase/D-cysteine desulfhydrase [Planctomycetota bacterium]|jgi:D-cysteine desulfhydrase family pyridoxal phosphate-dependent enzyme
MLHLAVGADDSKNTLYRRSYPMPTIQEIVRRFPRLHNSLLPTPVHRLDYLSDEFGANVYCKRDDLTGFGFGGNKTRKLDFLLPDALGRDCDTLIAIGANQSNFCRVAASYGAASGMDVHLVLGGKQPENPTGNLRLDHLLGVACHHLDSSDWDDWACEAKELENELVARGRKVYRMPVGGSTSRGALGYVDALAEIMEDQSRLGVEFDAILHASSSAGTQAGLVVGQAVSGWRGRIIGISVARPEIELEKEVLDLSRETAGQVGASLNSSSIVVDDSYIGEGYAARTPGCVEAVALFAQRLGIFLDFVYTGKAAAALIDYLRKGRFDKGTNVLFIHTGGNVQLFE